MVFLCVSHGSPILFSNGFFSCVFVAMVFSMSVPCLFKSFSNGFPMGFQCFPYGSPMICICFSHGCPMFSLCFHNGFANGFLMLSMFFKCFSNSFPMWLPLFSNGVPHGLVLMVFQWFSYVFPMVCQTTTCLPVPLLWFSHVMLFYVMVWFPVVFQRFPKIYFCFSHGFQMVVSFCFPMVVQWCLQWFSYVQWCSSFSHDFPVVL